MYCDYFGLRCLPFEDRADGHFYFPTPENEEILAEMEFQVRFGSGAALILGEPGSGKTLLSRVLVGKVPDHTVLLTWSPAGEQNLLRETCKAFGVSIPSTPQQDRLLSRLRGHLGRVRLSDRRALLIIDQAQNLTSDNLRELSALFEMSAAAQSPLAIVLLANPGIQRILQRPEFVSLKERFFGQRLIPPLTSQQTTRYVHHRLQIAGFAGRDLFEPSSLPLIHHASAGLPRLINRLCDAALVAAYAAQQQTISESVVEEVIQQRLSQATRVFEPKTIRRDDIPELHPIRPVRSPSGDGFSTPIFETTVAFLDDDSGNAMTSTSITDPSLPESTPTNPQSPGHSPASHQHHLAQILAQAQTATHSMTAPAVPRPPRKKSMSRKLRAALNNLRKEKKSLHIQLADITSASTQATLTMERLQQTCDTAQRIETRLAGFAQQIADKADTVQAGIARLFHRLHQVESSYTQSRSSFEQAVEQVARQAMEQTSRFIKQQLEAANRNALDIADQSVVRIRESANAQIATIDAKKTELDRAVLQQSDHLRTYEDRIEQLHARIQSAGAEAKTVEQQATNAVDLYRGEVARLQHEVTQSLERIQAQHSRSAEEAATTQLQVNAVTAQVTTLKSDLARLAQETASLTGCVASARSEAQLVADRFAQFEQKLDSARARAAELDQVASQAQQSIERLQQVTTDAFEMERRLDLARAAADGAAERLTESSQSASQTVEQVQALAHRLESAPTLVNQHQERLTAVLKSAQDTAAELKNCTTQAQPLCDAISTWIPRIEQQLADFHEIRNRAESILTGLLEANSAAQLTLQTLSDSNQTSRQQSQAMRLELNAAIDDAKTVIGQCQTVLDAMNQQTTLAAATWDQLASCIEPTRRLIIELNEHREQAARQIESAAAQSLSAQRVADQLASASHILAETKDAQHALRKSLDEHRAAHKALEDHLQRALAIREELTGMFQSAEHLRQAQESLTRAASDVHREVEAQSAVVQSSHELLQEFTRQVGVIDRDLAELRRNVEHLQRRLTESLAHPQEVLENARAQAEHLEKVCLTVRKVFAALSQAGLDAHQQTAELRSATQSAQTQLGALSTYLQKLHLLKQNIRPAGPASEDSPTPISSSPPHGARHSIPRQPDPTSHTRVLSEKARTPASRADEVRRLLEEARSEKMFA